MKFGVVLPDLDARLLASFAQDAEAAGWDAVFTWDGIGGGINPWVALTAVAMATTRLRFGTMLTAPTRRRPWQLASETATLDRLSNGRLILAVGLGAIDTGFDKYGEATERKIRAKRLDESLEIITRLWSAEPFSYKGEHYNLREVVGQKPAQSPRVPIWVVGALGYEKSLNRVARYDGLLPAKLAEDHSLLPVFPDDLKVMKGYIEGKRSNSFPLDVVMEAETPGDDQAKAVEIIQPFVDAGTTWWLESVWDTPWKQGGLEGMRQRVKQGHAII